MGPTNQLVRHDTLCPPEYWATAVNPGKAKRQWLGLQNALSRCPSATISASFRKEFGTGPSPCQQKTVAKKVAKKVANTVANKAVKKVAKKVVKKVAKKAVKKVAKKNTRKKAVSD